MIMVLALGLMRAVWDQIPALFALSGMGGSISAWLMYYERHSAGPSSSLIATFWTAWYWLGLVASLIVAAAAFWFYIKRVRAP
jgi:peptidoglycan biosynthesis protein MviN/MurJ (putative lipid II flippase)